MRMSSLPLEVPAVFLFEPTLGRPVSFNSSAARLLDFLALSQAPRITLAAIERGLAADARISMLSSTSAPAGDIQSELRRECRCTDGRVYVVTRVWSPGSNTILTVEDVTDRVVEARGRRLGQLLLRQIVSAPDSDAAARAALRVVQLFAGWAHGEIWMIEEEGPVRRALRDSSVPPMSGGEVETVRASDHGPVGRVLATGEPFVKHQPQTLATPALFAATLPLFVGEKLAGIMNFSSPARRSDGIAFEAIAAAAPLAALALAGKRDQDLLAMVKRRFSKTYVVPTASETAEARGG